MLELGRTRLDTRRQRARRMSAAAALLAGGLAAIWLATGLASLLAGAGWHPPTLGLRPPVQAGPGGLLGLPRPDGSTPPASRVQLPLAVSWPAVPGWSIAGLAVPVWAGWIYLLVRPLLQGLGRETRRRGLASAAAIRRGLGAGPARRAGRFTLPDTPWWQRLLLDTARFGIRLGSPVQPRMRRRLWATWEQRIRLIARTGWGKTSRVLVPAIRQLPGPAVISSTEPAIFEQTVRARQTRRVRLRWAWLDLLARRWLPVRDYPVAVVDFSAPEVRYAAGYEQVQWNLIDGCSDYALAYRRALAQVAGAEAEQDSDRGSDNDQFFRDSASEVLAAWLHAADLGGFEIEDLAEWQRSPQDPRPGRIIDDHPAADPSAAAALRTHLDPQAERTNSGVLRYLNLALRAMTSADGHRLCGRRFDQHGHRIPGFDMAGFIERGGTIYVLADPSRIERARPLLSMFTNELYFAAEQAALRRRGRKRLPLPFVGVHDELRYGITVSSLPYVANAQRKYGIGYIYSVQSSSQERAVYGHDAPALQDAAGVALFGGIDSEAAKEISDRAGQTPVVTATRGDFDSEHIQTQDALTIADQQRLDDGESVILGRGLAPFVAYTPSLYETRRVRRRITSEAEDVAGEVAAARARARATQHGHGVAAQAGADFGKD